MLNQNMTQTFQYIRVNQYLLVEMVRICIGFYHFCIAMLKRNSALTFDSHFAGTKEIFSGVDEEGNIYLGFECKEATDASHFLWGKSYEEIEDSDKFKIQTEGDQ